MIRLLETPQAREAAREELRKATAAKAATFRSRSPNDSDPGFIWFPCF